MRDAARVQREETRDHRPVFFGSLLSALDATGDLPQAFQELRLRFDQARALYGRGDLSAERYANVLSSMRCYDSEGRSWTIGASSGLWYRMIDDVWVQSPPPYQSAAAISSAASVYQSEAATQHDQQRSSGQPEDLAAATDPGEATLTDELLFGLPSQLFVDEAADQGPVPFGALPTLPVVRDSEPHPRRDSEPQD